MVAVPLCESASFSSSMKRNTYFGILRSLWLVFSTTNGSARLRQPRARRLSRSCRRRPPARRHRAGALEREEAALHRKSARVAPQAAVARDDAVAGDDDG